MFYTRADQADKGDTREWSTHTMNKGNNEQRGHLSLCSYLWPIILVGTRSIDRHEFVCFAALTLDLDSLYQYPSYWAAFALTHQVERRKILML
jgi:hypothetical protein